MAIIFLDKNEIKHFEQIVEEISNDELIEHICDVTHCIKYYNPELKEDEERLKAAAFTIIKELVWERKLIKPWYGFSFVSGTSKNPPQTEEDMFTYLDRNWFIGEGEFSRCYLIFFERNKKAAHQFFL